LGKVTLVQLSIVLGDSHMTQRIASSCGDAVSIKQKAGHIARWNPVEPVRVPAPGLLQFAHDERTTCCNLVPFLLPLGFKPRPEHRFFGRRDLQHPSDCGIAD